GLPKRAKGIEPSTFSLGRLDRPIASRDSSAVCGARRARLHQRLHKASAIGSARAGNRRHPPMRLEARSAHGRNGQSAATSCATDQVSGADRRGAATPRGFGGARFEIVSVTVPAA
ncbi:MAG: hypothetical protein KJZ54_14095, partial [Phycisphaerales bacterium]|nr:hypothetical protein [Phycisphaerales bacterium]